MKSSISLKQIITLETGKRSTLSGRLLNVRDGRVRWTTLCPNASGPMEVRDSLDSGRTWGPPEPCVQYLDGKPLTRAHILQQAGFAMMALANTLPQSALSLLL